MIIANLKSTLNLIKKQHPEAETLVDTFTPLLICEEELLEELKMKKPAISLKKQKEKVPYIDVKEFPICSEKSNIVCQKLLESMKQSFPQLLDIIDLFQENIKPNTARRLCKEFIADREKRDELIINFINKNIISDESKDEEYFERAFCVLELLLKRASHTLLARTARSLESIKEHEGSKTCPYCGGLPNMSVIRQKEGQRELLCSECGSLWRYKRSQCHACGTEADKNLQMTFVDDNKNERALECEACKTYILEVDVRDQQIMPENVHVLSLGMAHLDVLMQQK